MRTVALAVVLVVVATGCATSEVTPSASVTTLMPDSERWFKLSWEAVPEKDGEHLRLRGYLQNTYGEAAGKVQLLAQALDNTGNVIDQKLWWVSGVVPGFGRVYYEIPKVPKADHYRVTVWSYERIQGRDGGVIIPR
jgi:hypothetical protein